MSYIVIQDGKVGLSEEGLLVPVVKDMLLHLKADKAKIMEYIRFVYYMADKYSPYMNYVDSERLIKIKREQYSYMSQEDFDAMASDEVLLLVLEDYKDKTYDLLDRGWDMAKTRVDNFLKHLNNVPMTIVKTAEVYHDYEVDGENKRKKIKLDVEVSNHEEYWKALKTFNEVMKFVSKVEEDIKKDTKEGKRKNTKRRLFDNEESLRMAHGKPRLLL
jgi:hypothetical protein